MVSEYCHNCSSKLWWPEAGSGVNQQ